MSELSEKKVAWIAITGIMGSGKSTCIAQLKKWGYDVLSCDEVAKELLKVDSGLSVDRQAIWKRNFK